MRKKFWSKNMKGTLEWMLGIWWWGTVVRDSEFSYTLGSTVVDLRVCTKGKGFKDYS